MSISSPQSLKSKLHEIIFEADTRAGKLFDVWLLIFILLSLIIVMLDSVEAISNQYAQSLFIIEWFFTIIFSIEYLGRVYSVGKPSYYIFSFYGLIDLLSILPTFINLFIPVFNCVLIFHFK